jgi:urease accessory protein
MKLEEAGKHGILRVVVEARGGRTVVADQFWRVPLQVMPPTYQDDDGQAFLYILNPTGGVVQGDRLEVDIAVRPGAQLLLTTQSATKVYRMEEGWGCETNAFAVGAGGLLEYLPDQTIPYARASFRRVTRVDLDATATAIVSDILSAGRVARGEVFEFTHVETEFIVRTEGELRLIDRLRLIPGNSAVDGLGLWEGHHYYGAVYVVSPAARELLTERVAGYLENQEGVRGGVTLPEPGVLVVRVLGHTMWRMKEVLFEVWDILRRQLVGKPARTLRKF